MKKQDLTLAETRKCKIKRMNIMNLRHRSCDILDSEGTEKNSKDSEQVINRKGESCWHSVTPEAKEE